MLELIGGVFRFSEKDPFIINRLTYGCFDRDESTQNYRYPKTTATCKCSRTLYVNIVAVVISPEGVYKYSGAVSSVPMHLIDNYRGTGSNLQPRGPVHSWVYIYDSKHGVWLCSHELLPYCSLEEISGGTSRVVGPLCRIIGEVYDKAD